MYFYQNTKKYSGYKKTRKAKKNRFSHAWKLDINKSESHIV